MMLASAQQQADRPHAGRDVIAPAREVADSATGEAIIVATDDTKWMAANADSLTPADLAAFRRLGIPRSLLAEAHVRRVTNDEARHTYGILGSVTQDMSGIVFPYFDPTTGWRVTARVRRANPEFEDGRPKNKYVSAYGGRKHLYFRPALSRNCKTPAPQSCSWKRRSLRYP